MATRFNNTNGSIAEVSPATARNPQSRFAMFMDSDDADDTGGGVRLCDFDEEGNSIETPTATCSTASSGNSRRHARKDTSSAATTNAPTSARRNKIAPIGTGRLNARAITFTSKKPIIDEDGEHDEMAGNTKHTAASVQNRANVTSNNRSHMSPTQGMQLDGNQGGYAQSSMATPSINRGTMQQTIAPATSGYPWGTTPARYNNIAGVKYNTPQPSAYDAPFGSGLGSNFPVVNPDTTPSHAPKKAAPPQLATPSSVVAHNQYNQTEPRNFAPRASGTPIYLPPPPAFTLGRETANKKYQGGYHTEPDADPFVSPTANRVSAAPAFSQALALAPVPENNMPAVMPHPAFYAPTSVEVQAVRSTQLNMLTEGPLGMPSHDIGLSDSNFPFIDSASQAAPVGFGVVKIKNIPFGTKRAEIIAFLGRNSRILNDNQEPVHIIMERVSSKTQDCYVEFVTLQDAVKAAERHKENVQRGRPTRLGDRPVEIQVSSQAALMQDLFPLASGVFWDGAKPMIQAPIPGQPWKTFKGFVTEEEMTMLVKHVEMPQRSPYSKECPQRPYECMISTLKKLPWYMSGYITIAQRHSIVDATMKMVVLLQQALQRGNRLQETTINEQLLKRLVTAAMLCPGFSVVQKDNIAVLANMDQERARMFNQPRFAEEWVHLHAICPRPGIPLDVLEWYIAVIREETTRHIHTKSVAERADIQHRSYYTSQYFGYVWTELNMPTGKDLGNLTLGWVAQHELRVLDRVLRRAFPRVDSSN